MNSHQLLKSLNEKPVFTLADIRRRVSSPAYAKQLVHRLQRQDLIARVAQNRYTINDDPLVVATHLVTPCYLSFWSASAFYGYTEQILNTIQIATTHKRKSTVYKGVRIQFFPLKEIYGYRKFATPVGELFIADPEKLLIDCFLRPQAIGNFTEILNVIEKAPCSKEKIIEYLKRANNSALTKRLGYLLEKKRSIDISSQIKLDTNYVFLNPFSKRRTSTNAKWRVKL